METPRVATIPVLCVDVSPGRTTQIQSRLEAWPGFAVERAETATEARRRLAERPEIACLLVVHDPPETDGFAVLETVREEFPEVPVVFYTSDGSAEVAARALSAGATAYIRREDTDPNGETIVETVTNAIDENWATRALHERLKELSAIRAVVGLLTEPSERSLGKLLADVVERIPAGFRYPETTEARIRVGESTVATEGYRTGGPALSVSTVTVNGVAVTLEVISTGAHPPADEGPFLAEERELLETLLALLRGCLERRAYLSELTESEQLFRELAENVNEVVWITDPQKEQMLYVNPAYEAVWGRSAASLYDEPRSFVEAVHPEDRERVERAIAAQAEGERYDEEYRIVRPEGRIRWIHDRAVPVESEAGEVYRIVGLAEDVTPRKEREQQIAVLSRVLRHNLRNDMNAIRSYAELIAARADGEVGAYADRIVVVADRLMALAEKNRRLAAGLADPSTATRIDLTTLLSRLVADVERHHPGACVAVDALDPGSVSVPAGIEIALAELLANAVEHNDAETPNVDVTVTVDETEDESELRVEIRIDDDGPGVPDAEWAVLGTDEEPLSHGSGVGLWLAHWVVTQVGGTLERVDENSRGATLVVRVPGRWATRNPERRSPPDG